MRFSTRSFLPTSLVAILVVAIVLATLYIRSGTQALIRLGEEYNVVLTRVVSNSLQKELLGILGPEGRDEPERRVLIEDANKAVKVVIENTPIVWVRMYDANGGMVMSTGTMDVLAAEMHPGELMSAISGGVASTLRVFRVESGEHNEVTEVRVIESYVPFAWNVDGVSIRGVFEIYFDTQHFEKNLYINPLLVLTVTFSIMALLYTVIFLLYRRILRDANWRESVRKRENLLERVSSRFIESQEEERRKIGRDIHDDAGQWLSALKFRLEGLRDMDIPDECREANEIDKMLELVQRAIDSVRHVATQLRPSILDDLGLGAALNWLVRTSNDSYPGLEINLDIDCVNESDLPAPLKTTIFRVTQEALSNMGRHSKAGKGMVRLTGRSNKVAIEISDDGQGFDLKSVCNTDGSSTGFGLTNMQERTEVAGGKFRIITAPGMGTVVTATWVLAAE